MIRGIVFDFNGTLVDDDGVQAIAWNESDRRLGIRPEDRKNLQNVHAFTTSQGIQSLLPGVDPLIVDMLAKQKEEIYRKESRKKNLKLRDGVEELFDWLKENGIPFTIASASILPNMEFFLDWYGINRWLGLEEMVYDDGSFSSKGEMFARAAGKLGLHPEEILIIEDSPTSIETALAHGIREIIQMKKKDPGYVHPETVLQVDGFTDGKLKEYIAGKLDI